MYKKDIYALYILGLAEELGMEAEELSELYKKYIHECGMEVDCALEYFEKKDWNMLQRTIHNLKGMSANLGILIVSEIAGELDAELKAKKYEDISFKLNKLIEIISESIENIKKFYSLKEILL